MSHIYWELHEIPRPEGSYINHSDGRVFLMKDNGLGQSKRQVIGRAASETMMHPNDLYKYLYPEEWKQYYGSGQLPEHELHVGMYAAVLGIGYSTNLYPVVQEVYGPLYGNAIMDYAMYSIMEQSDATHLFPERMAGQVLFSREAYSDEWYSDLFRRHMPEDANAQFRALWLKECAKRGVRKVWLSIDGSNNDCNVKASSLAEPGKAKSRTDSAVVSCIWAVDAETGSPVTYCVNNGGMADSRAFQKMALLLKDSGIGIEGIILDRGFVSHDVLVMLQECSYPYVLMLKSDTYGHIKMMERYASEIRWKADHVINDAGLFGITDTQQIFGQYPEKAHINLYFDGSNASGRALTLIRKVRTAVREGEDAIRRGKKPSIPSGLSPYLQAVKEGSSWAIRYNYEAWQEAVDRKGFCSIASSVDLGPEEADRLYHLRDASETQYMIMKSQMGYDTTRVHSTESIQSKFTVCFIAAILRNEFQQACKSLGYDTNRMLREIDRTALILLADGLYSTVNNQSVRQCEVFHACGVERSYFKFFADDVNRRLVNPINSQIHRLPNDPAVNEKKKRGRPAKKKDESSSETPKRRPGRPRGSKNRKTPAREAEEGTPQVRRKPGRPKGSKNKSTIEKERLAQSEKRKPGRPKGSKNKSES